MFSELRTIQRHCLEKHIVIISYLDTCFNNKLHNGTPTNQHTMKVIVEGLCMTYWISSWVVECMSMEFILPLEDWRFQSQKGIEQYRIMRNVESPPSGRKL